MCQFCPTRLGRFASSGTLSRRSLLARGVTAAAAFAAARTVGAGPALAADPPSGRADMIIENAKVVTLDVARPRADAIAFAGDTIVGVGSRADIERSRTPGTRVVDAGGRTVIPGLNDSHAHLIRGGLTYSQELRWDGVPSLAVALRLLREQALRTPAPHWVQVVGGWTSAQFAERRLPTLDEINAATGDVPCFVMHIYDRAFLNRAALRVLGYAKETADPFGGQLERRPDGTPTGLVVNVASIGSLLGIFARIPKLGPADQIASTKLFMRELNRLGVTSVLDAGGGGQNYPDNYAAIARLAADKELTVRIGYSLFAQRPGKEIDDYRSWVDQVKPGDGDDYLRMVGAGEYMVWATHDPANFAKDVVPPTPANEAQLVDAIKLVVSRGWPFRLHANYDETAKRIVAAIETAHREVPVDGVRWIIDHAETIQPDTLERVAKLGGSIAIQNRMSLDGDAFASRYGAAAAADAPPIGRMRGMGLKVACGTDGNRASSHNPWVGLHWLVTGRTAGGTRLQAERNLLDREEALRLFSTAGAWFSREEERKGTIAPGRWADLAILSDDYLTVPEERIPNLSSVLTLLGGRVVHGSDAFAAQAPARPPVAQDWLPVEHYRSYTQAALHGDGRELAGALLAETANVRIASDSGSYDLGCLCGLI